MRRRCLESAPMVSCGENPIVLQLLFSALDLHRRCRHRHRRPACHFFLLGHDNACHGLHANTTNRTIAVVAAYNLITLQFRSLPQLAVIDSLIVSRSLLCRGLYAKRTSRTFADVGTQRTIFSFDLCDNSHELVSRSIVRPDPGVGCCRLSQGWSFAALFSRIAYVLSE